jgi:hypothetical protein
MPSVPQSLLWISLVVLWLFVLVPMLISKRDAVRRTSDVALATRVLNSAGARKLKRGPAAGHRSDPDWQPAEDEDLDLDDEAETVPRAVVVADVSEAARGALADDLADEEPDYLDVDVVEEDSGALPAGIGEPVGEEPEQPEAESSEAEEPGEAEAELAEAEEPGEAEAELAEAEEPEEAEAELAEAEEQEEAEAESAEADVPVASEDYGTEDDGAEDDGTADEYEYVEDTSGLESGDDPPTIVSSGRSRRRMYDSKAAAAARARKYKSRKRTVSVLVLALVVSGAAAFTVWPQGKWLCATVGAITVMYLVYLRRQTRIEERLRRRRLQRIARSRLGVENTSDRDLDLVPSRLRRPGAVVLEIDDEDPIFEHLEDLPGPMEYHLSRAAGQ